MMIGVDSCVCLLSRVLSACSVRRKSTAVGLPKSGWRMFGIAPRGFATAGDDSNESRWRCVPETPAPSILVVSRPIIRRRVGNQRA